jgi:hypothetical protein
MFFRLLDTARTKSHEARKRIAFGVAMIVTVLVGGIWTMTLPARFSGDSLASEGTKPFAGLVAGFRDQFSFLRQQAGVITSGMPVATTTDTATSILIDVEALLASTTLDVPPDPVATPILIGTTSATTSSSE